MSINLKAPQIAQHYVEHILHDNNSEFSASEAINFRRRTLTMRTLETMNFQKFPETENVSTEEAEEMLFPWENFMVVWFWCEN